jgi:hypothetical protein
MALLITTNHAATRLGVPSADPTKRQIYFTDMYRVVQIFYIAEGHALRTAGSNPAGYTQYVQNVLLAVRLLRGGQKVDPKSVAGKAWEAHRKYLDRSNLRLVHGPSRGVWKKCEERVHPETLWELSEYQGPAGIGNAWQFASQAIQETQ